MMEIKHLASVEKMLDHYRPAAKEFTGKDMTLKRMQPFMAKIGNPEKKLKIIHIAGTSGKSSTAYYTSELLKLAGQKVGLTVSPHVDSISERVQINNRLLPEEKFCSLFSRFLEIIKDVKPQPSYYELLIAFAFWVFELEQVDYAVVETGLGGLQDGSNVANNPNKVCVITDIGYDHMHILGYTLPEIALQKAGIIHNGNVALMFDQPKEVLSVVQNWCKQHRAKLVIFKQTDIKSELPPFQRRNWQLAKHVFDYMQQRDKLSELSDQQLLASQKIAIPARMEIVNWNGKTLVMDGAHNAQKMEQFIKSFRQRFPASKPAVLLSVRTKKDFVSVIDQLMQIAEQIILTRFKVTQDITHMSAALEPIVKHAKNGGFKNIVIEADHNKALKLLESSASKEVVITGSFYLLNHIRPLLKRDTL